MLELIKTESSSTDHELFRKQKMYTDRTETTPTQLFFIQRVATSFQPRSNAEILTINDTILINIRLMLLST
jgi:hypothetical protein